MAATGVAAPSGATMHHGVLVSTTLQHRGALVQQALLDDYVTAREGYKRTHAQFSTRVVTAAAAAATTARSRFDQFCQQAFHDLSFHTSAVDPTVCCPPSRCGHGTHKAGLHEVNDALRRAAQERMGAAPVKPRRTGDDVFALLVTQEAAEHHDLLVIEASQFRQLAHTYYQHVYGPRDRLLWQERKARAALEDAHSQAQVTLLAQVREELWLAEQQLLLRAMNECPQLLPHQRQLRLMSSSTHDGDSGSSHGALDSMLALPLWHRACAIRGETESEEDISFRRLRFACSVVAHCLEEGYLVRVVESGVLRRTEKALPHFMKDAVDYAFQFEQFAVVMREETTRMQLMDSAEEALSALLK